ncbi:MAG: methionyl-tRNA formyltransferase [Candidatus Saccharimonadales bacterium]
MMNTSKTLLFFGNERLVSGLKTTNVPILKGLIDHGYDIKAVISHHSDGNSRNNRKLEVAEVAAAHNIPVLLPDRPTDIADQIASYGAHAAILVAYGRIIPQSIIDLFPLGIINIHPSLLPQYRGPTPIESAIINGDSKTGVSIMQLSAGMDSGPVYGQTEVLLTGHETKFELYNTIAFKSATLLFSLLPHILDESLVPTPQKNTNASYSQLLQKSDGQLDPSLLTAVQADRHVRAYLGFPKSKINLLGQDCIITKSHVEHSKKTPLDIVCQDGAFLSIDELVAPSGRTMSAIAFLNGYAA